MSLVARLTESGLKDLRGQNSLKSGHAGYGIQGMEVPSKESKESGAAYRVDFP